MAKRTRTEQKTVATDAKKASVGSVERFTVFILSAREPFVNGKILGKTC